MYWEFLCRMQIELNETKDKLQCAKTEVCVPYT